MKKLLLSILFLLFTTFGISQGYSELVFPNSNGGYGWQQVGAQCNGCASFFVGVSRSDYPNEYGNYKYSIFYQTNSFDQMGNPRMTYINNIYFYYYDYNGGYWIPLERNEIWVLCNNSPFMAYSTFSPNPQLPIKITAGSYVIR